MLWFVHLSALAGLLAVSIPIIIHLIKLNQKRQQVPSLLLFTSLKKTTRRWELRNILLLLCRILVIMFLVFLLSRPFLKKESDSIKGSDNETVLLSLVIDDSLTSLLGGKDGTSFEFARERAIHAVAKLSDESMVTIASTSCGGCSLPMSPTQAIELLRKMEPIAVPGRLGEAIRNSWQRMQSLKEFSFGGILVIAPPVAGLWRDAGDIPASIPKKWIMYASPWGDDPEAAPYIQSARLSSDRSYLTVKVGGSVKRLPRCELVVRDPAGRKLGSATISVEELQTRIVKIPAGRLLGEKSLVVQAVEPDGALADEPLARYYFDLAGPSQTSEAVIIYDETPLGEFYAQVAYFALDATMGDSNQKLHMVNLSKGADSLQELTQVGSVFLCPVKDYGLVTDWVSRTAENGAGVIVFPTTRPLTLSGKVISFGESETLRQEQPLVLASRTGIDPRYIQIYGKGLRHVKVRTIRPAVAVKGDKPLFQCNGQAVVALRRLPGGSSVALWGLPLQEASAIGLLANPLFPQLIEILAYDRSAGGAQGLYVPGRAVELGSWLNLEAGRGICIPPSGPREKVVWSSSRPSRLYLESAGFYTFNLQTKSADGNDDQSVIRSVNFPRPEPNWLDVGGISDDFPAVKLMAADQDAEFRSIPHDGDDSVDRPITTASDLTPLIAIFLWAFIIIETILAAAKTLQTGALS